MSSNEVDDAEIYASFGEIDTNLQGDASFILWKIWRFARPQYSTLMACVDAVNNDPRLHDALKVAHNKKNYASIRNWKSIEVLPTPDARVDDDIHKVLNDVEESLKNFINGYISLPVWLPKDTHMQPHIRLHLEDLKIPMIKERPNLLLHRWGSFQKDLALKKRLDNIFMPNNHTFLVNTSGSGKTRILLEGLCNKWGFYFTSTVDSSLLGSSDIQNSIQSYIPYSPNFRDKLPLAGTTDYGIGLRSNRLIAGKVFRRVFLARLLIFHHFVEIMERERTPYSSLDTFRERWLLLQLQPHLVCPAGAWDIFDDLTCRLSEASDHFIAVRTQDLLKRVREFCSEKSDASVEETPFFCVLDEAQYAATKHTSSFRSDHDGSQRPILREIVRAWEELISGRGVFMVIAGTGISKNVVDQAMASAIMKESRYRWCSDTGAFDSFEAQRLYLSQYLPKHLLESEVGKRLLERLWYWLHGRYRFTAGYVTELIRDGFRRPHRLLNAYVQHFTGFSITDAAEYVENEDEAPLPSFSQYKLDFSKLQKNSDMLPTIHRITTHYMMRCVTPYLGKDETMYVEYGFARFDDSETRVIVLDEPLVIVAAIFWMDQNCRETYRCLSREIGTHEKSFNGFENYIVYCIDLIFSETRRLSDVFNFHSQIPPWANMEAKLVSVYRPSRNKEEICVACFARTTASSANLGTNAKSSDRTMSWLEHRRQSPFCFPDQSMGPDIMFVLQLSDQSLIWVALQTKYSKGRKGKLEKGLLRHAIASVTPSNYFLDKNGKPFSPVAYPNLREDLFRSLLALPNRRSDAGKYSLLRVVASFPAQTRMKRFKERDPDQGGHPVASLNMDLVKRVTQKLSPQALLEGPGFQTLSPCKEKGDKRKRKTKEESVLRRKKLRI